MARLSLRQVTQLIIGGPFEGREEGVSHDPFAPSGQSSDFVEALRTLGYGQQLTQGTYAMGYAIQSASNKLKGELPELTQLIDSVLKANGSSLDSIESFAIALPAIETQLINNPLLKQEIEISIGREKGTR